ncbi:MAG: hypothetical protein LBJ95_02600 [Oscillospiraceae bacterium]|jgi:hypothetical protein|nr:hypothetical protein [Oscillospiraceae bacterium]
MPIDKSSELLEAIGAKGEILQELLDYTANRFGKNPQIPEVIAEEPFIGAWKSFIEKVKDQGIVAALNNNISHGEEDIVLQKPEGVKIEIYDSLAGPIPIFYATDTKDFEELVIKLIHKGKEFPGIEKTGASFANGKSTRFIILSNKPYSNIPAQKLGLEDEQWKDFSLIIRREHECTHYFTKRFLGSSQNNLHDELIADYAGMSSAAGEYHADWFLIGMGIDDYPKPQTEGRFSIYTVGLSDEAKDVLKKITVKAARNIEKWSKKDENRKLTLREQILFLCSLSLLELYELKA